MLKFIMILILLLAVGLTVPKTRVMIDREVKPLVDHFKEKVVPGRLRGLAEELAARIHRGEGYPPSWSGWLQMDYTGNPVDPWGHQYYLKHIPEGFLVGSNGPDGIEGNSDDITFRQDLSRH